MNNQNPAEMSNEDLENDMDNKKPSNQEKVKKSTAAEGDLISPENDENSKDNIASADPTQDGNLPDPDEAGDWEKREDPNKISG
jgi:hypothetical protein